MKDATRYNLPAAQMARDSAAPPPQVSFVNYGDLKPGDRVWWSAQLVEITQQMHGQGNIVRFRTEFVSGPLKGCPCYISGLAYASAQIQPRAAEGSL